MALSPARAAEVLEAVFSAATEVPVTAGSFTATGQTIHLSLGFVPATGTTLTVVKNTGLDFIHGTFDNLAQGQAVDLDFGGTTYHFVANYYGGTGNDLVVTAIPEPSTTAAILGLLVFSGVAAHRAKKRRTAVATEMI